MEQVFWRGIHTTSRFSLQEIHLSLQRKVTPFEIQFSSSTNFASKRAAHFETNVCPNCRRISEKTLMMWDAASYATFLINKKDEHFTREGPSVPCEIFRSFTLQKGNFFPEANAERPLACKTHYFPLQLSLTILFVRKETMMRKSKLCREIWKNRRGR